MVLALDMCACTVTPKTESMQGTSNDDAGNKSDRNQKL